MNSDYRTHEPARDNTKKSAPAESKEKLSSLISSSKQSIRSAAPLGRGKHLRIPGMSLSGSIRSLSYQF